VKLVIVGKQSAGKSSLLQSLTDIPFQVGTRLCTRFATRIVSKRTGPSESDLVRASIEPGDLNPFNYREDDEGTESFNRIIPSMSAEEFENIVKDVTSSQLSV
jgi:GTPase SAR1 family protein